MSGLRFRWSSTVPAVHGGSLVAAPLVALVGLPGAIVATGLLAAGYAGFVALPARSVGRHRAPRVAVVPEPAVA